MEKVCLVLVLIGQVVLAVPENRWSRQIYSSRVPVPVTRERRQFSVGDWIPLTQPCPTCRPLTDSIDAGTNKQDDIGLTPPRPPTVTRQIHNTNFFPQDASSILSAPPPPTFTTRHHLTNPNPQYQGFLQQFGNPSHLQFPPQQFFPQPQPPQFLPQTYLNNQGLLLSTNAPVVPVFNNPILGQPNQDGKKEQKVELKPQKQPTNVLIEQNKRPELTQPLTRLELPLPNAPTQFLPQQQIVHINPSDSFLVPPAPKTNNTVQQNIEIPGLEKEEIQLLYVPVETLRQRGHFQQDQRLQTPKIPDIYQTLPQNIPFNNQQFLQVRPGQPNGHFITQAPGSSVQPSTTVKQAPVTPPTTLLLQSLPVQETAQPFLPETPTTQTFPTASPLTQDYPLTSSNVPERVVTIPSRQPSTVSTVQYFPTTPKAVSNHLTLKETLQNDLLNDKTLSSDKQNFLQNQKLNQNFFTSNRQPFLSSLPVELTTEVPLTTTLTPHQPPLSVFMRGSDAGDVRVVDVLRALKDATTINVLDHFSNNAPKVFVGPANLTPPKGYGKFELPYLSNIDTNRVERKVERLPFFVAPLNFNPPPGYSKIPFPAPHVGSVVVSNENNIRSNFLQEKATTVTPLEEEFSSANFPSVSPDIPGLINDLETEVQTTTPVPETTTSRLRSRRPNNAYRPPGRRPVPNSRLRTSTKPEVDETIQKVQNSDILKEVDSTKENDKRFRNNYFKPRRQRVKTTTEAVTENQQTETPNIENTYFSQEITQPQTQRTEFAEASSPDTFSSQIDQITDPNEGRKEVQGIFEVHSQPELSVNNNGNSGFFDQNQYPLTEQPVSSTQFFEHQSLISSSTQEPQYSEPSSENPKTVEEETEKTVEIPKQRHNLPNVPGVKSVPNPSIVKTKSHVRSRPRGHLNFATSQTTASTTSRKEIVNENQGQENEEVTNSPVHAETEATRTKSRYNQYYRGQRKPLRTTTTTTTTTESTRETESKVNSYTLRPQRRTTVRTSVSTKRIRKPTTPIPDSESENSDSYGQKNEQEYSPSGVSNDVYDDQVRPKSRKPYTYSETTSTSSPITTRNYQSRKDENVVEETKTQGKSEVYPEWNPSESGLDISRISLTTESSNEEEDEVEEHKKQENSKKAFDPELEKKNGRRRIRVRVHKRPHDNFEAAESQNVGTVANVLVPPTPSKPNEEPDLYHFTTGNDFSFDATGRFAGTKNVEHVRNITSDILENTQSFSAPGLENQTDVQKVTIVSETPTTEIPTGNDSNEKTDEATTTVVDALETTTDYTTSEPDFTTQIPTKVHHSRIIKTSTTTQISHETEICYKGKCIKTNSDSPDKDLKLLVETANLEENDKTTQT